jgi:Prenyltransferase and squalene oxidase repeat
MQQLGRIVQWLSINDSSRSPTNALLDAIGFLLQQQDSDGAWRDFRVKPGRSDAWVTAYVGDRLLRVAQHHSIEIDPAISAACRFLENARHKTGGWGYNLLCSPDSDTTAQVILFLKRAIGSVRAFDYATLAKFQLADGAFATYRTKDPTHGWGRGHPEVTATALRALRTLLHPDHLILRRGFARLAEFLRGPDPLASYWWPSHWYLERELLTLAHQSPAASSISMPNANGSDCRGCFDLALALEVAVFRNGDLKLVSELARQLAALQRPDGGWPTLPILRITDPRSLEFGDRWFSSSPVISDDRRLFTTATALVALEAAGRVIRVDHLLYSSESLHRENPDPLDFCSANCTSTGHGKR